MPLGAAKDEHFSFFQRSCQLGLKLHKWILSNTAPTTRYVFLLFCSIFPLFGKTFDFLGVTKNCFAYYYLDNSKVLNLRNSATRFTVQWYLPAYQKFIRSDLPTYVPKGAVRVIDPKFVYLFYDFLGYPRTHSYGTEVHTNFFSNLFRFCYNFHRNSITIACLEPHLTDK